MEGKEVDFASVKIAKLLMHQHKISSILTISSLLTVRSLSSGENMDGQKTSVIEKMGDSMVFVQDEELI